MHVCLSFGWDLEYGSTSMSLCVSFVHQNQCYDPLTFNIPNENIDLIADHSVLQLSRDDDFMNQYIFLSPNLISGFVGEVSSQ